MSVRLVSCTGNQKCDEICREHSQIYFLSQKYSNMDSVLKSNHLGCE